MFYVLLKNTSGLDNQSGTIYYSSNGMNWSRGQSATMRGIYDFIAGDNYVALVGYDYTYSYDAVMYYNATSFENSLSKYTFWSGSYSGTSLYTIDYYNNVFIITGLYYTGSENIVYYLTSSQLGKSWQQKTLYTNEISNSVSNLIQTSCFIQGTYYLLGEYNYDDYSNAVIYYSNNLNFILQ